MDVHEDIAGRVIWIEKGRSDPDGELWICESEGSSTFCLDARMNSLMIIVLWLDEVQRVLGSVQAKKESPLSLFIVRPSSLFVLRPLSLSKDTYR